MKSIDIVKCFTCGNESDRKLWTKIEAQSNDGYTNLMYSRYDKHVNRWVTGAATVISCPKCNTIRME